MTLFWQQFKAQFMGLVIWLGSGIGLGLLVAQSAPSFVQGDLLGQLLNTMPEALVKMMGIEPGLKPLDTFVASQVSKTLVLVSALYAVLLALNAITREVDRRTIDFLLSLPVRRTAVLLARAAVMLVNTGIVIAGMGLTLWASFRAAGLEGSWAAYNLIYLNVWLLAVAMGGIALLASLWIDDYGVGVKLMMGLVSGAYFMEFVFRAAGLSRAARLISPFSYVDATAVLRNSVLPLGDTLVLVAVSALTIGLSLPLFERKEITS